MVAAYWIATSSGFDQATWTGETSSSAWKNAVVPASEVVAGRRQ
jgi:hypothetical protein